MPPSPYLFVLFVPAYVLAMGLVLFVVSKMGWEPFAIKYRAAIRPIGPSYLCSQARFGALFASYSNVVQVIFSESGVFLYPFFLFRAFHPPLLVPWNKVIGIKEKKQFLGTERELEIRDEVGAIYLILTQGALNELRRFYKT